MYLLVLLSLILAPCPNSCQDFVALPPSIIIGPPPRILYFTPARHIKMNCFVSGHPFPRVTWYKDGDLLNTNQDHVSVTDDSQVVTINPGGAQSSWEGYYYCKADNNYGRAISNSTRYLRAYSDRTGEDLTKTLQAKQWRHFVLKYGTNLVNVPNGTVIWRAGSDDVINLDNRIQLDDNGDLHFAYVLPEDSRSNAVYKAVSYNAPLDQLVGSSYSRINVEKAEVEGIYPHIAFHSPPHMVALEGQNFSVRCFFAGNPSPEIQWSGPGRILPPGRHTIDFSRLTILNAMESDSGVYRCTGRNAYGESTHTINVAIEAFPRFLSEAESPSNQNITENGDAIFRCSGYGNPPPLHQWIIDGQPMTSYKLPRKVSLSGDGKVLIIRNVCKHCPDENHDLRVIQCNISNRHGYLLASGYLNVLTKTTAHLSGNSPTETVLDREEKTLTYQCGAVSDPSTPATILWSRRISLPSYSVLYGTYYEKEDYEILPKESPNVEVSEFGKLILYRRRDDRKTWTDIGSKFKCTVTNGYSDDEKFVELNIPDSPVTMKQGLVNWWWLLLLLVLLLVLIVVFLIACRNVLKQKGSEYDVDAREKSNGHEPEKELISNGFKAYRRPDDVVYLKGSEPSLGSSGHCSDEEGSLNDYGLAESGKFNEDGSFVGAYVTNSKMTPSKIRKEYITSPLTRYYT